MATNKPLLREYTGSEIVTVSEDIYEPIVDSILHKGDIVMLNGLPKSNKSTFAMQLACCVSSGAPLFGVFKVPKPGLVWYFSTEGKDNEIKERFIRMSKAVQTNFDNIRLFCSSQFKINTPQGVHAINELIAKHEKRLPLLIVIDSLYSGFFGTLTSDESVNSYFTAIRGLAESCQDSGVFIPHHTKKPIRTLEGVIIPQTDMDGYGSVFFGGQADHLFLIDVCKKDKMNRIVTCSTQRSGKIVEELYLHLNEPEPFYLSLVGSHDDEIDKISKLLESRQEGLKASKIMDELGLKKSLTYIILNELVNSGKLVKTGGYNGVYSTPENSGRFPKTTFP